jgi:hypothetical protein
MATVRHLYKEFSLTGGVTTRDTICFADYVNGFYHTRIKAIHFYIPLSTINKIPKEHYDFYINFLNKILNKEVWHSFEEGGNLIFDINCEALKFNKHLVFLYLCFFRYLLEFPKAVTIFYNNNNKGRKSVAAKLESFTEQQMNNDYIVSGVTNPNHSILGYWSGRIARSTKEIRADILNPSVIKDCLWKYFLNYKQ